MIVVMNAELAQSYIAQARSSGRLRPSQSSIEGRSDTVAMRFLSVRVVSE